MPGQSDVFCDHCGQRLAQTLHTACSERRRLEPPRYCTMCRRRMVVQVTPTGWSARCSEHGVIAGDGSAQAI